MIISPQWVDGLHSKPTVCRAGAWLHGQFAEQGLDGETELRQQQADVVPIS